MSNYTDHQSVTVSSGPAESAQVDQGPHTADHGGVTRVTIGSDRVARTPTEAPTDTRPANARHGLTVHLNHESGKLVRVNASGEAEVSESVSRVTSGREFTGSEGVLATARSIAGALIPAQLLAQKDPHHVIVRVGAMETSLASAVALGLVTHDPATGQYKETGAQPEPTVAQPSEDTIPQPFPEEHANAQELLDGLEADLPPAVSQRVLSAFVTGEFDAAALSDLCAHAGVEPSEMQAALGDIADAFEAQAQAAIAAAGVDPADIANAWGWMRSQRSAEMREALHRQVFTRDPSLYTKLAKGYLRSIAPSADSARRGGLEVRRAADGTELVTIGGVEMPLASAARLGLL